MTEGSGERLAKEVTEIGKKRDRLRLRSGILLDENPQGSEKVQKRWHFHMNRKLPKVSGGRKTWSWFEGCHT